ncbi:unnamed protein product [Cuscuta campestris]|uniref:Uncharacterized protein n=1 Tax=Cuscuta campestris TaxID=132261 RepID=A0A484KL17_9ASTE|nr:unnamed protein product [Cuscuta campestris]
MFGRKMQLRKRKKGIPGENAEQEKNQAQEDPISQEDEMPSIEKIDQLNGEKFLVAEVELEENTDQRTSRDELNTDQEIGEDEVNTEQECSEEEECARKKKSATVERKEREKNKQRKRKKKVLGEEEELNKIGVKSIKTRMSPKTIIELLKNLSEEQKEDVREMGFGRLLQLDISHLPLQLGYWLVENFDTRNVSLKLPSKKEIHINETSIHSTIGFPMGGESVMKKNGEKSEEVREVMRAWKLQFPVQKGTVRIADVFYVDNVIFKSRRVQRQFPSFVRWNTRLLWERERAGKKSGGFGYGYIDVPNVEKIELTSPNLNKESQTNQSDGGNQDELHVQKEKMDVIKAFASATKNLAEAISLFDEKLRAAVQVLPDDEAMKMLKKHKKGDKREHSMMGQPLGYFHKKAKRDVIMRWFMIGGVAADDVGGVTEHAEKERDWVAADVGENGELHADVRGGGDVADVENVKKVLSEVWILDMAVEKNNREVEQNKKGNQDECPERIAERQKGRKRDVPLSAALRSPFMNRIVDIRSTLTIEERMVEEFTFSVDSDDNVLYKEGDKSIKKGHFQSLKLNSAVSFEIIDLWTDILNHKEKFKSNDSSARVFFPTKICDVLDYNVGSSATTRNKNFVENSGVFTMRFMETYKGEAEWDCGLENINEKLMQKLRTRYLNEMLTFEKNEMKEEVVKKIKSGLIAQKEIKKAAKGK